MDADPNVAQPAVDFPGFWIRYCIGESFAYQPVVMSLLTAALVLSFWLIGLRIRGCFQTPAPENRNPFHLGWVGLLEFALGRLVLAGMAFNLCLSMLKIAYASRQGAAIRLPLERLTSIDVYILCTPLLAASLVYANCTVSSLIGKIKHRAS